MTSQIPNHGGKAIEDGSDGKHPRLEDLALETVGDSVELVDGLLERRSIESGAEGSEARSDDQQLTGQVDQVVEASHVHSDGRRPRPDGGGPALEARRPGVRPRPRRHRLGPGGVERLLQQRLLRFIPFLIAVCRSREALQLICRSEENIELAGRERKRVLQDPIQKAFERVTEVGRPPQIHRGRHTLERVHRPVDLSQGGLILGGLLQGTQAVREALEDFLRLLHEELTVRVGVHKDPDQTERISVTRAFTSFGWNGFRRYAFTPILSACRAISSWPTLETMMIRARGSRARISSAATKPVLLGMTTSRVTKSGFSLA